jgi:hypothetical protein
LAWRYADDRTTHIAIQGALNSKPGMENVNDEQYQKRRGTSDE